MIKENDLGVYFIIGIGTTSGILATHEHRAHAKLAGALSGKLDIPIFAQE